MKKSHVDILCTLIFMMGVFVGILMHPPFGWHDVAELLIATVVFHVFRVLNIRSTLKSVSRIKGLL